MTAMKLTRFARPATSAAMMDQWRDPVKGRAETCLGGHAVRALTQLNTICLMSVAFSLAGCVTVNAPDKPIVIELNINIKQEVVYRLSADAGKTIDQNKEIF
jgi:hypothetical protein